MTSRFEDLFMQDIDHTKLSRAASAAILGLCLALLCGCATREQTFASPEIAVESLVAAIRADDPDRVKLIFGPDADKIVSSGDSVADRSARDKFLQAYDKKHALVEEQDGSMTLLVGKDDWPFPIPIVKKAKHEWYFDVASGEDEIISRRIGHNELSAIQVCLAIVDAQRDYALMDPDGDGVPAYAQFALSSPGTRDGLYWPTNPGEPPSPLGELVADATQEGYSATARPTEPRPYHGYCYRLLKSQGSHAPGGAMDYEVNGKLIGGFGVVAYPAIYGNSGVMTFIVNHNGVVYQKDLGPDTTQIARRMTAFDPGPDWTRAE